MIQYIKFKLTPGQQAPEGNTGITLSDGYLVWTGEENTFKSDASIGTVLSGDITPNTKIEYKEMTEEEIQEFLKLSTASIVDIDELEARVVVLENKVTTLGTK